jgi:hypothetical protein
MRVLPVVALMGLLLCLGVSCDKLGGAMKNVPGKVAGRVLDANGQSRGYVSMELQPEDGSEPYKMNVEDNGSFMFDSVRPGKYKMVVKDLGDNEIPSDNPMVSVGPGRTITKDVNLTTASEAQSASG